MRLLRAVPGSVLWLLQDNPWTADNLRQEAQARSVDPDRLIFAPHFVYAQDYRPAQDPRGHALYAGRLSPEKGVLTLLEAAARVPDLRLVLAGDGPQRAALEERARALGLGGRVRFAGYLRGGDYDRVWEGAAFLVLPSECYEVRPMAIHEAYARGCPAVSTRIGTIPEIVQEGETGFLSPPFQPAALAAVLAEALGDPERLAAMGRAARDCVETSLTPEAHWRGLEAAYDRALSRRRSRAA